MGIGIGYDPTEWRLQDRQSQYKPTEKLAVGDIIVVMADA